MAFHVVNLQVTASTGAGPLLHHNEKGCPTFRDFRKVGTTSLDAAFASHRPPLNSELSE
jgi:hypothetical protein